ncbi:hypothetical protein [Alloacidobacterium sp.]|uniref:hypothetical protein n=1 Tax=Alloacidobacterium sp. TaxID=2951999 RepID=UPI0032C237B6
MAEWGRKQYAKPWPSRTRWWTLGAVVLAVAFFVFAVWFDGYENWTAAQRLYLSHYLKSGARAQAGPRMGCDVQRAQECISDRVSRRDDRVREAHRESVRTALDEIGQPEIKGYTREYLEASSPRRRQIEEYMEKAGVRGLAPRRSPRIRRATPNSPHRMKGCERSTSDSQPNTASSRSTLSKRRRSGPVWT